MQKTLFVFARNSFLFIFVLLVSLGCCVGAVFVYNNLYSEGAFSTWRILDNPPSEISKILAADISTVWVESIDGTIYSLDIQCSYQVGECNITNWAKIDPAAVDLPVDFPNDGIETDHGDTCKFGDVFDLKFFREPDGNMVECWRVVVFGHETAATFYAKMDNNKIQFLYTHPKPNFELLDLVIFSVWTGLVLGILSYAVLYILLLRK